MPAEVFGINGRPAPAADGSEPEVIEVLEEVLMMARRGEIGAVAIAAVAKNLDVVTKARNPRGHRHLLVAACEYLKFDLCREPKD